MQTMDSEILLKIVRVAQYVPVVLGDRGGSVGDGECDGDCSAEGKPSVEQGKLERIESKSTDGNVSFGSSLPSNLGVTGSLRFSSPLAFSTPSGTSQSPTSSELGDPLEVLRLHGLTAEYTVIQKNLGQGTFGTVHVVKKNATGERFALKTVPLRPGQKALDTMVAEIVHSAEFDHPFVVKLHGFVQGPKRYHLLMELCTGGSLTAFLKTHVEKVRLIEPTYCGGVDTKTVTRFAYQMLAGLIFLHRHGFVHRDIKPDNYLLTQDSGSMLSRTPMSLKLADFGLACRLRRGEKLEKRAGTPFYMAPEVERGPYDEKCDIWSLGATLYYIHTNSLPFDSHSVEDYRRHAACGEILYNEDMWAAHPPKHEQMVLQMMTPDPEARPSAKRLYSERPWLHMASREVQATQQGCCVVS
eukprot:CAMPEP_0203946490 /NCGR_PEP_ID=MMETSP0359-20131031/81735_1 /ASSEMBLY_ACC=CAM_ASM_000338 /TAXON_ID=268821 /ORGANISM="Scrippsiella Hangoei, Strain SHTV-5" /LENGTH=412 /DNA_ID=CAMNT_0050877801 /DNA_START=62 /DNA_END=1300 /DNA_ORIENTATION=+